MEVIGAGVGIAAPALACLIAKIGQDPINRMLGPSADAVGVKLEAWTEKRL